jgi:hypothetical protein
MHQGMIDGAIEGQGDRRGDRDTIAIAAIEAGVKGCRQPWIGRQGAGGQQQG